MHLAVKCTGILKQSEREIDIWIWGSKIRFNFSRGPKNTNLFGNHISWSIFHDWKVSVFFFHDLLADLKG